MLTGAPGEVAAEAVGKGGGFLHLWLASLEEHRAAGGVPTDLLSPDEMERARRFVHHAHGAEYALCRALLRTLLSAYLPCRPGEIAFRYGMFGKPLLGRAHSEPLSFNLAHSGDRLLVAVTAGPSVGVDLEGVREIDHETLARHFFTAGEVAALARSPAEDRVRAFFGCWTRKEAYVKARGDGLSIPLHRFEVSCPPAPAALLRVEGMEREPSRWTLMALDAGPAHAATVAVERPVPTVRLHRWAPTHP